MTAWNRIPPRWLGRATYPRRTRDVGGARLLTLVGFGVFAAILVAASLPTLSRDHAAQGNSEAGRLAATPAIPSSHRLTETSSGPSKLPAIDHPDFSGPGARSQEVRALSGTNSSPIAETGTVVAKVGVGTDPFGSAYNPVNGFVYVPNYGTDNVSILNGTQVIATVYCGLSSAPQGAAYDSANHFVYVADSGTNLVSVISGTTLLTSVPVPSTPYALAYDAADQEVYVADYGNSNVTVISGTTVVATVGVGANPTGVAYDASNQEIYVANSGGSSVSILSGTKVNHTIAGGAGPFGVAYVDWNQEIYVSDPASNSVKVINDTTAVATVRVGSMPEEMVYDPGNGHLYVSNFNGASLSVIHDVKVIGNVSVGGGPRGGSYDPSNGEVYISDFNGFMVSVVSTLLAVDAPTALPVGNPTNTADVGQTVFFGATLWAPGTGVDSPTAILNPSSGLGCSPSVNLTVGPGGGQLSLLCVPASTGPYTILIEVTDGASNTAWAQIPFEVYSDPTAPVPIASSGPRVGITSADVLQTVTLTEASTGGTGIYAFVWNGLPAGRCLAATTYRTTCYFNVTGVLTMSAVVTDSDGASATSYPLVLTVFADPQTVLPTANPPSADVGQSVTLDERATGGPGRWLSYAWVGLTGGNCRGLVSAQPVCVFTAAARLSITVTATDGDGITTSSSPSLALTIYALPLITDPTTNRTSVDVGQARSFSTTGSGGSGPLSYSWSGLPPVCRSPSSSAPSCTPSSPGTLNVSVAAVDPNGGHSIPSGVVSVAVFSDPRISDPQLSSGSIPVGGSLTVRVIVSGGSGTFTYRWSGLPGGCTEAGPVATCHPTSTGSFAVRVTVTDSNGVQATSTAGTVDVTSAQLWGIPALVLYGAVAGAAVTALVLLLRARRRRVARLPALEGEAEEPPSGG